MKKNFLLVSTAGQKVSKWCLKFERWILRQFSSSWLRNSHLQELSCNVMRAVRQSINFAHCRGRTLWLNYICIKRTQNRIWFVDQISSLPPCIVFFRDYFVKEHDEVLYLYAVFWRGIWYTTLWQHWLLNLGPLIWPSPTEYSAHNSFVQRVQPSGMRGQPHRKVPQENSRDSQSEHSLFQINCLIALWNMSGNHDLTLPLAIEIVAHLFKASVDDIVIMLARPKRT